MAVERRKRTATTSPYSENAAEKLIAPGHGADRVLLDQERRATLERLVSALPAQLRNALVLSALEEIAPREVAAMLGISEAAVRSRAFRAREILREKLLATPGPRN